MRPLPVLAMSCLLTSTALAQPGMTPARPLYQPAGGSEPAVETESYAAYTLTVDGIAMSLFVGGILAEGDNGADTDTSEQLMTAGMLGLTFGAPFVHLTRGHVGRAFGSFGMRVGFASIGMGLAMASASGCDGFLCEMDGIGAGYLVGTFLAAVVDAATMTDEPTPAQTWAPQLSASSDGVRAGVAFTF